MATSFYPNTSWSICPSCGGVIQQGLDFCVSCMQNYCKYCGELKPCGNYECRLEAILEQHADALEQYTVQKVPVTVAIRLIRESNRPTCLICGTPLFKAKKNSIFCSGRMECLKMRRKYTKLVEKGLSKAEALGKILEETS